MVSLLKVDTEWRTIAPICSPAKTAENCSRYETGRGVQDCTSQCHLELKDRRRFAYYHELHHVRFLSEADIRRCWRTLISGMLHIERLSNKPSNRTLRFL
ncbi:hypothetical protein IE4803_PD00226 (plasmid) [Rhizobium etli bv. phaseoli str. IE4803]|nr:hypothetical protein IE4803_PD00226 [Rhizobium etli bv. phaseoli str. IE4803]